MSETLIAILPSVAKIVYSFLVAWIAWQIIKLQMKCNGYEIEIMSLQRSQAELRTYIEDLQKDYNYLAGRVVLLTQDKKREQK